MLYSEQWQRYAWLDWTVNPYRTTSYSRSRRIPERADANDTARQRSISFYKEQQTLEDSIKNDILRNISLFGAATEENAIIRPIVGSRTNVEQIVDFSSGAPRLRAKVIKRFSLILGQPKDIIEMHNMQIRCCLCNKAISYPAWYYSIKFSLNVFHYFICFDSNDNTKPTTHCYRRG